MHLPGWWKEKRMFFALKYGLTILFRCTDRQETLVASRCYPTRFPTRGLIPPVGLGLGTMAFSLGRFSWRWVLSCLLLFHGLPGLRSRLSCLRLGRTLTGETFPTAADREEGLRNGAHKLCFSHKHFVTLVSVSRVPRITCITIRWTFS